MSVIINKFLLVGTWPSPLTEIGATISKDLYEANYYFERSHFDVLGVNLTTLLEKKFDSYFVKWRSLNPHLQIVAVIPKEFSQNQLIDLHNSYGFFRVFNDYNETDIVNHLYLTLEKSYQEKQIENYKSLLNDQNLKLKKINSDLEEKIEKRTRYLVESRKRLFITNYRIESYRKALTTIYKSLNIEELESNLNKELLKTFDIQWIKIFYSPDDNYFVEELNKKLDYHFLRFAFYRQNKEVGSVFFMRSKTHSFTKEESEFLNRITETVSFAVERIEKRSKMELIKKQWESSFNAIKEPVLLINDSYEVVQSNQYLDSQAIDSVNDVTSESSKIPTKKCYQILFSLDKPCIGCERGQNFKIKNSQNHFEVFSQKVQIHKDIFYVNQYSKLNEKLELESKILLMAPDAELGIISSSLAHEINNPLSGLLSFIQLMIMDSNSTDEHYSDFKDLEIAAKKCRDIVNNLLVFTRKSDQDKNVVVNLFEIINKAFLLFQIQKQNKIIHLTYNISKEIQVKSSPIKLLQFFVELFMTIKSHSGNQIKEIMIDSPTNPTNCDSLKTNGNTNGNESTTGNANENKTENGNRNGFKLQIGPLVKIPDAEIETILKKFSLSGKVLSGLSHELSNQLGCENTGNNNVYQKDDLNKKLTIDFSTGAATT